MANLSFGDIPLLNTDFLTASSGTPATEFKTGMTLDGRPVWCTVYNTTITYTASTTINQDLFTITDIFKLFDLQGIHGGAVPFPLTDPYVIHANLHFNLSVVDNVRTGRFFIRAKNYDSTTYKQGLTVYAYYLKV